MKLDKPFWETGVNPVTGHKESSWDYVDDRTLILKKRLLVKECIIINDEL